MGKPCRLLSKKPGTHFCDRESGPWPWVFVDDPTVAQSSFSGQLSVARTIPYNYVLLTSQQRSHTCSVVTEV